MTPQEFVRMIADFKTTAEFAAVEPEHGNSADTQELDVLIAIARNIRNEMQS